LNLELKNSFS
jgi:hypothetical protein